MADIHKIISRQIKSYFEDHNLTMAEVAEMMGCSQQAVSNQLSGRPIGGRVAKAYVDLFGFDANYLITGVGTLLPEQAEERPQPKVQEGVFIDQHRTNNCNFYAKRGNLSVTPPLIQSEDG